MTAPDPFRDPAIQARIATEVSRILARWEGRERGPFVPRVTDKEITDTLLALFEVHASSYFLAVDNETAVAPFSGLLSRIGATLLNDVLQWDVLQGPYNEESIRAIAMESGDLPARAHTLSPDELEREISSHVNRIKHLREQEAERWTQWKDSMLQQMQIAIEKRIQHWTARAEEHQHRTHKKSLPEGISEIGPPHDLSSQVGRRAAVDSYIAEVFRVTGKRITRSDIWKAARYTTRTEFERWERGYKRVNKTAHQRISRVLTEKPHLK